MSHDGNIIGDLIVIFVFVAFTFGPMLFWYFLGKHFESKHFESLRQRESKLIYMPVIPSDNIDDEDKIVASGLVTGSVVIGTDPFKRWFAALVNIVGGRVSVFEPVLDRARREAVLRAKEKAAKLKADAIINFRMETMSINKGRKSKPAGIVEIMTYGTAVRYAKNDK